eukprot:jgi/Ulvmu1/6966/UM033_0023.1
MCCSAGCTVLGHGLRSGRCPCTCSIRPQRRRAVKQETCCWACCHQAHQAAAHDAYHETHRGLPWLRRMRRVFMWSKRGSLHRCMSRRSSHLQEVWTCTARAYAAQDDGSVFAIGRCTQLQKWQSGRMSSQQTGVYKPADQSLAWGNSSSIRVVVDDVCRNGFTL